MNDKNGKPTKRILLVQLLLVLLAVGVASIVLRLNSSAPRQELAEKNVKTVYKQVKSVNAPLQPVGLPHFTTVKFEPAAESAQVTQAVSAEKLNLAGKWFLRQSTSQNFITANLPGDVHSALLEAGKIPDPNVMMNEKAVQWVGEKDWIYSRDFQVPASLLKRDSVYLELTMVDTFATVSINDKVVGRTNNMFRRWRFECKDALKEGLNKISIRLDSSSRKAFEESRYVPYEVPYIGHNQVPNINLIRKVQCHPGWDWGITLMVTGVYGDLCLNGIDSAQIEHVFTRQDHEYEKCKVTVTVELKALAAGPRKLSVKLGDTAKEGVVDLVKGYNRVAIPIDVDNPKLWWPNGYGEQPLYDLTVTTCGQTIKKKLGLRKVEIIRDDVDFYELPVSLSYEAREKVGKGLTVRVNGVDVFCKGANWIPLDAMPGKQTPERYKYLVESAADANMNMLRVWGGGQYEHDVFYELCDEKGIMVWQDMMFACSLYPATDEFLSNVQKEATYQVKRLRDHPSIVLWCGDNEVMGALNWYTISKNYRDRYLTAYDRLNQTLKRAVNAADDTRMFWPSSPCGGDDFYTDGWFNESNGDSHYWAVWHGSKDFDAFYSVLPRFCSEFGYQSFPSFDTVRQFCPRDQFDVTSPVMEHHQRNPNGNRKIVTMFTRYFRMPKSFRQFLYLSQVQQALAIKTAVEYWRHLKPACMGTLYWQLNDNWPVASWSSIEYGGNWKQLHYQAKRFYAPVIGCVIQVPRVTSDSTSSEYRVWPYREPTKEESATVWVISDLKYRCKADVFIKLYDLDGKLLNNWQHSISLGAGKTSGVKRFSLTDPDQRMQNAFLIVDTIARDQNGKIYHHRNVHFFADYKSCSLRKAKVTREVMETNDVLTVKLKTDKPAFFVSLETVGVSGVFSDNSFVLMPGEEKVVTFKPRTQTTLEAFKKALVLTHLADTY